MTLGELRGREGPQFFALLKENFPQEEAVYETTPEGFDRRVRRIYRWDTRFVTGLLRAVGRPVFLVHVLREGGRVVGIVLVTFPHRAAYLSNLVVDPAWRRRGFARRLIAQVRSDAARYDRPYVVLDVLTSNEAAARLYARERFTEFMRSTVYVRDLGDRPPRSDASVPPFLRAAHRRDVAPLLEIARREVPEPVGRILTRDGGSILPSRSVERVLGSQSRVWVVDDGSGAVGHLAATRADAQRAGFLSAPILAAGVDDRRAEALVAAALDWLHDQGAPRAVCQVPQYALRSVAAIERSGFAPAHELRSLVGAAV